MRNKIQKYLSGDHEGFSLVELIIVIAIMAILIGVVALAVLPYLEKSRESKDISMLDTINSAMVSSVAATQVKGDGQFVFSNDTISGNSGNGKIVSDDMKDTVGGNSATFNSNALKNAKIMCKFDASANKMYTFAGNGSDWTKVYCFKRTTTNAAVPSAITSRDDNGGKGTSDEGKEALVTN